MRKNLFAYTAPDEAYPPYVSINQLDDTVEVSVRGEPSVDDNGHLQPGPLVTVSIPAATWDNRNEA